MTNNPHQMTPHPVVMSFSSLDPCGGSGLQAEILAINSMGCHCAPISTCQTTQTTQDRSPVIEACDTNMLITQARSVLEDMPVQAFHIGLPGSQASIEAIHTLISDYPDIPAVLAPNPGLMILLEQEHLLQAICNLLVPLSNLVVINDQDLNKMIAGSDTSEAAAMGLLSQGCSHLLVTGSKVQSGKTGNTLYGNHRALKTHHWDRLEGFFTGAQATLSAASAALIAQGQDVPSAVFKAEQYTWHCLEHGSHLGMGRKIPDRLFWARNSK